MRMKKLLILILLSNAFFCFGEVTPFTEAMKTLREKDNRILFHVIKSPYGLNWSERPLDLIFSIAKNQYLFPYTDKSIGHITAEIKCEGRPFIFTGQSVKDLMSFRNKIIHEGVGFSLLNSPSNYPDQKMITVEGKLDEQSPLEEEFNKLASIEKALSVLAFDLTKSQCLSAYEFIEEYHQRTKNNFEAAGNNYGFGADPLKFEGAGCAPYAMSLMKKAGKESYIDQFLRTVYIDKDLIGFTKPVKIWDILLSQSSINKASVKKLKFTFPDPDLVHEFVEKKSKTYLENTKVKFLIL